jgi:hypothetical protein
MPTVSRTRASFVRTAGERDRIYVVRPNGTTASWAFPTYGDALPHDLVHLVVESGFGVARGVWGRVAAGADLGRVNEAANRRGAGEKKYAALGDDLAELWLAEALVNAPWLQAELAPSVDELVAALKVGVAAAGLPRPRSIARERVAPIRARLAGLAERWRGLVPKGAIDLDYPDRIT